MAEQYPLYIQGVERGSLRVKEEGIRTLFEAECPDDGAGIYRAAAVGTGGRLNLGAMAPERGRLTVRRSFSRDEMTRAGVSSVFSGEAFLSVPFSGHRSEPVTPLREENARFRVAAGEPTRKAVSGPCAGGRRRGPSGSDDQKRKEKTG